MDPKMWPVYITLIVELSLFLRWLYRRMRDDDIIRAFVRDVATNHLPHLYQGMKQLAAAQGIELEDPPLVQFVDLGRGSKNE